MTLASRHLLSLFAVAVIFNGVCLFFSSSRFVKCSDCGRRMHQICVLHHDTIWPLGWVSDWPRFFLGGGGGGLWGMRTFGVDVVSMDTAFASGWVSLLRVHVFCIEQGIHPSDGLIWLSLTSRFPALCVCSFVCDGCLKKTNKTRKENKYAAKRKWTSLQLA